MVLVTKRVAIRACVDGCRAIRLLIVANTTRRDLATRWGFTRRIMATIAAVMRREVSRNRKSDAAVRRRMASIATLLWPRFAFHMLGVIELHVETFVEARGKILERWIAALCVAMANQAHRDCRRCELSAMTIGAGFVAGEARRGRVVRALVTRRAGKGTVSLARVEEFGIIELGPLCRRRGAEAQRNDCDTDDPKSFTHLMSLRFSGGRSAIK